MLISEIKLSSEFKVQTTKSIISIVLFAISYVAILSTAVVLAVFCIVTSVGLISSHPGILTVGIGLGLASLGIVVLLFLIKFIFKSHKTDLSHLKEIKKEDEPDLFHMIQEIVETISTKFPKKVYLSADVNAAVFYNSNFWSMIFPVRKNLMIGIGLINTVTEAELKAILSHEFGHFSQKTMKVGSYVYNVNQVIFNMLFDNESYDKLIHNWARLSGYFSFFILMAIKIIEGIQWLLAKLYGIVNKSYLGLSREMEFHADEIAANVTGYKPLKSSLLRLPLSEHAYQSVLQYYDGKVEQNVKSENIFSEHFYFMNFLAKEDELPFKNDLPDVSIDETNKFNKSKLIIKDQWASHPSTEERIERLQNYKVIDKTTNQNLAKNIFQNISKYEKELTKNLFKSVEYSNEPKVQNLEEFINDFNLEFEKNTFSKIYNSYYDNKNPMVFDLNSVQNRSSNKTFEALFSDKVLDMIFNSTALESDLEAISQITSKLIDVKTFDYDGKKYNRKSGKKLIPVLKKELSDLNAKIKENDIEIYLYFKELEEKLGGERKLQSKYTKFFEFDQKSEERIDIYVKLNEALQFLQARTEFDEIRRNFVEISYLETKLKDALRELLSNPLYQSEISPSIRKNAELYFSQVWRYFDGESYIEGNLEILYGAINNYSFLLSRGYFLLKKDILKYQAKLYQNLQSVK